MASAVTPKAEVDVVVDDANAVAVATTEPTTGLDLEPPRASDSKDLSPRLRIMSSRAELNVPSKTNMKKRLMPCAYTCLYSTNLTPNTSTISLNT